MDRSSPPSLTVQVDVDTTRHLLTFYGFGDGSTSAADPTYSRALPRFAELFSTLGIRATFFVVGQDLENPDNAAVIRSLSRAGHEIANHTYSHDYRFAGLSRSGKRIEIERAHHAIGRATGQTPVGFRAPGWDVDREVLDALADLGYLYDSSVLPSVLNMPARALQPLLRRGRRSGYGSPRLCWAPRRPYRPSPVAIWQPAAVGTLWEVPPTVVPGLRLPFYATFNLLTGEVVFSLSARLLAGQPCNYVLHAVDLLDPSEIDPRLRRHPTVRLPLPEKARRCRSFLDRLRRGRRVLLSRELAAELNEAAVVHADGPRCLHHEDTP